MAWPDGLEKVRVLMTADAVGGVWQYTLDLAEGLRPHGVETTIALLGPAPSLDQWATSEGTGAKIILTDLPLDWTATGRGDVEKAGRAIARMARMIEADLVHLNSPALAADAGFNVPVAAICHSCVATWWEAVRGGPLPEEFIWRADLVRRGYAAADTILAPTAAFAQTTARVYDLAQVPIVVRNGRRAMEQSDTGAASEPFIFTAGRLWDEGKNFAAINRVAPRLPAPVLVAGPLNGPNGTWVDASHVQALGRLSDAQVAWYLSKRPIFVSMALYEPFGLTVLEAAQAGCALVLSDIPTFRELWEGAALFVDPNDDDALAEALTRLLRDREARAVLGHAARECAGAYTVDAMCAGVLNAYRSVLCPRPRQPSLEGAAA